MTRLILLGIALLSFIALPTSGASAQGLRVAVAPFSGPQGGRVNDAVIASLEENGVTVVLWEDVQAHANRDRLQESDYPEVGGALMLRAFVTGRVSRRGRRWSVRLSVRDGASNERLGSATLTGRNVGALRRAARSNGYERLRPLLEQAVVPAGEAPPEVQATGGTAWYETPTEEEAPPGYEGEEEEEEEEGPEGEHQYDALRFWVGGGTLKRTMETRALGERLGPDPADPSMLRRVTFDESRSYVSGGIGHGELALGVEFFPGALLEQPVVPWLGVNLYYRHAVGLSSTGPSCPSWETERSCPAQPVVNIDTTQREFYAGIRADADVIGNGRGLFITGDIGFGLFSFTLDPTDLQNIAREQILPPVTYSYLNLGAGFRYYAIPEFAIGAHGGYRVGFGVGQDARAVWGVQTSGPQGWHVGGSLEGRLDMLVEGLFLRATVDYFRFTTTFEGPEACAVLDGSTCSEAALWESVDIPDPVDDSYLRLGLAIGYAL